MDLQQRRKENQLYKEISDYSRKFSFMVKLNEHDREEVIIDTMLKLLEKEAAGVIQLTSDYNYKGYMTFVLKNFLYKKFQVKETAKAKFHNIYLEEQIFSNQDVTDTEIENNREHFSPLDDELFDTDLKEIKQEYRDVMNLLTPIQRSVVRWRARGWQVNEIAKGMGSHPPLIQYHFQKALKIIKEKLNLRFEISRKNRP